MHPSIMYGMFGPHSQWDGAPVHEKPLFYEGVSELSSYFLQRADTEIQDIKNQITKITGQELEAVWPLRLNLKKVCSRFPPTASSAALLGFYHFWPARCTALWLATIAPSCWPCARTVPTKLSARP